MEHSFWKEEKNKYQKTYEKLTGFSKGSFLVPRILPAIIPPKWIVDGDLPLEAPEVTQLVEFFQSNRNKLKENTNPFLAAFLFGAKNLDPMQGISSERKLELLCKVCDQGGSVEESFWLIGCFAAKQQALILNTIPLENPLEELKEAFKNQIVERFSASTGVIDSSLSAQELVDRYKKTFGNLRIPFGLEIYEGVLRYSEPAVREALNRFVYSVVLGTFQEERHRTDNNPHLKQIQAYDPTFLNTWKSFEAKQKDFSFKEFVREQFYNNHITQNDLPVLFHHLHPESLPVDSSVGKRDLVKAQNLCIELMEEELSKEDRLKKMRNIVELLEPESVHSEFKNDLKTTIQMLTERVVFTQNWQDLFLAGSEVIGSCQRIDSAEKDSKCLLAYCLDGKNAMIAVKDEVTGKILARSMLRLLWDPKANKPVLFLDRLYPLDCSAKRASEILSAAKECAKELKCELFELSDIPTDKEIVSLGSSCPYEYADAAGGVKKEGKFSVRAKKIKLREVVS